MLIKRGKIRRKQSLPSLKLQIKGYENVQQTIAFWHYVYITGKFPIRHRDGMNLSYYPEAKRMAIETHQAYIEGYSRITTVARTKRRITQQKRLERFLRYEANKQQEAQNK